MSKEILKEFLEWLPHNLDDIFEIVDNPNGVIDRYIEEQWYYATKTNKRWELKYKEMKQAKLLFISQ